jgi:pyridoxine/pyridoxamine 5'-phosphate oxidase
MSHQPHLQQQNPMILFDEWFRETLVALHPEAAAKLAAAAASSTPDAPLPYVGITDAPYIMTLSTVDPSTMFPSSRNVLLKDYRLGSDPAFTFVTNFDSCKSKQLQQNEGRCSLLFYWTAPHQRQIKIEGIATKLSQAENEAMFYVRPREHQIASAASKQSSELPGGRAQLL